MAETEDNIFPVFVLITLFWLKKKKKKMFFKKITEDYTKKIERLTEIQVLTKKFNERV